MNFTPLHYAELTLLVCAIGIIVIAALQQEQHLKTVPQVVTAAHLELFKNFARVQMYLTLLLLICVVPAIAIIFIEDAETTLTENIILWSPYGVIGLSSFYTKSREKKIRDENRCVPELRTAFGDVCYAWGKKLLPTF
jgi:hypothetical protein